MLRTELYQKIKEFGQPVKKAYFNSFLCWKHIKTVYVIAIAGSKRKVVVDCERHERDGPSFKLAKDSRGVPEFGLADD